MQIITYKINAFPDKLIIFTEQVFVCQRRTRSGIQKLDMLEDKICCNAPGFRVCVEKFVLFECALVP